MFQPLRFGRRVAIPSKRQIIHEMRMLQAEEERLKMAPPVSSQSIGSGAGADTVPLR